MSNEVNADPRRLGRPTREDAAGLAQTILDGAFRIFCDQGYAASMDEIAAAIGMSKLTIYRRFPSKEALLIAVIDDALATYAQTIFDVGNGDQTPMAALKSAAWLMFDMGLMPDSIRLSRLLITVAATNAQLRDRLEDWESLANAPVIERIRAAQANGDIVPGDPALLAVILRDLLRGLAWTVRHLDRALPDAESATAYFDARWAFFEQAVQVR